MLKMKKIFQSSLGSKSKARKPIGITHKRQNKLLKDRSILKINDINNSVLTSVPSKFKLAFGFKRKSPNNESISFPSFDSHSHSSSHIHSHSLSSSFSLPLYEKSNWKLLLNENYQKIMETIGIPTPNETQCRAIPFILKSNSQVYIGAETGSGKTLAYLVPIIHKIKMEEMETIQMKEIENQNQNHSKETIPTIENQNALNTFESNNFNENKNSPDFILSPSSKSFNFGKSGKGGGPKGIILVPTYELVNQTIEVAKQLAHHVKLRFRLLKSNMTNKEINHLFPMDLLISTPFMLQSFIQRGIINLIDTRHLVIDEADTLLSDDYLDSIQFILNSMNGKNGNLRENNFSLSIPSQSLLAINKNSNSNSNFQYTINKNSNLVTSNLGTNLADSTSSSSSLSTMILSSATMNIKIGKFIQKYWSNMNIITTNNFHHLNGTNCKFKFHFIGMEGRERKCQTILNNHSSLATIIFCNRSRTAERLHDWFTAANTGNQNENINESNLNSNSNFDSNFNPFLSVIPSVVHGLVPDHQRKVIMNKFRQGSIKHLITTDLNSRGIDTTFVDHVIMYDCPRNVMDFIHRAGRTARGENRFGLVSVIYGKKNKELVQFIKMSLRQNKSLAEPIRNKNTKKLNNKMERMNRMKEGGKMERKGKIYKEKSSISLKSSRNEKGKNNLNMKNMKNNLNLNRKNKK